MMSVLSVEDQRTARTSAIVQAPAFEQICFQSYELVRNRPRLGLIYVWDFMSERRGGIPTRHLLDRKNIGTATRLTTCPTAACPIWKVTKVLEDSADMRTGKRRFFTKGSCRFLCLRRKKQLEFQAVIDTDDGQCLESLRFCAVCEPRCVCQRNLWYSSWLTRHIRHQSRLNQSKVGLRT